MNQQYSIKHIHFKLTIPYIILLIGIVPFLTSNDPFTQILVGTNGLTTYYMVMQHIIQGYKHRKIINTYDKSELQQIILSVLFVPAILFATNLLFTILVTTLIFIIIFIPFLGIPAVLFGSYGLYRIDKIILEKYNRLINQNEQS